ncbi:unnamed protein product [Heligmosomoides polygyrus]|uniref:MEDS domain-containing protein n=1 Tax=Heligmosomoides polygyrus TaxID=6339 RepID=A0A183FB49_HELPZ|nr:unnamed protein product [Heligmosomoides polygyrus]
MNAALYDTILHYLSSVDPDLQSVLCCVSEEDSRSQFSKVLLYLEDFWAYLDVDAVLIFFKGIQFYSFMTSRIEKSLEGIEDDSVKKRVILRTLPLLGNEAIYDLMRAIYDHSEKSADFVNRLHPGFLRFYNLLVKERCHPRGVVYFCPTGVPVEDVMKTDLSTAQKYKVNLNYEDLPPALLRGEHLAGRLLKSIDQRLFAGDCFFKRRLQTIS